MQMHRLNVPAVSVAVIENYNIDWTRAWGVTDVRGSSPASADTMFQAASISKAVAAMAIMHLVDSDKLNLDTDVNDYLRTWKVPDNEFTRTRPVTMRELLSHSAGANIHGFAGYRVGQPVPGLPQILDGVAPANSEPVRIESVPSTAWKYSGGGFEIAEQVVADITAEPFSSFVQTTLLGPLGMGHSTFVQPLPTALEANAASGTLADGSQVPGRWHTYPELAAAGLWTTPSDLARFAIALMNAKRGVGNSVLSSAAASQMLTPVIRTDSGFDQALGVVMQGAGPEARFSKDGDNVGFKSMLVGYLSGHGVVVMTNSDNGMALALAILRSVQRVYGWQPEARSRPAM